MNEAYLTDCMKYMATVPDKYFDLACPDVPYAIGVGKMAFTQEIGRSCKQKNGSIITVKKTPSIVKHWDNATPTQEYFDELVRISHHQIIWGVNYVNWEGLGPGRIKWNKGFSEGVSFSQYEYAYCSMIDYERTIDLLWAGFQQAKSIAEPMTAQGNKKLNEKRIHICQKPVMLYKILFRDYTQPGFKIFDSHLGSGSSRIAAFDMGLDFIGCETDIDHFNDQELRYQNHIKPLMLFTHEQLNRNK